jgi:hypothetical protein
MGLHLRRGGLVEQRHEQAPCAVRCR